MQFSVRHPLLLLCFLLAGINLCAQNRAYYVSSSGNDTGTGHSLTEAWRTISYGLATIAPGDTLLVADGTYVETDLLIDQQSTPERPTVVKSINPWGAKIKGTQQYSTILRTEGARHVVIDGFEVFNPEQRPFQDWNTGINIYRSNYVTVQNCYVRDCGCGGIGGRESDYMTIRRNVTRGNAKTNPYNCSGISIYQPTQLDDEPGTHILISGNVTFENECRLPFTPLGFDVPTDGNGIILDDFNWTQDLGDGPRQRPFVAETVVENNLSFDNGGAGMKAYEVANAVFRNNTSVHNNHVLEEFGDNIAEIAGQAVSGDVVFSNNIAVQGFGQQGNALYWQPIGDTATLEVSNNLVVGEITWQRTPDLEADNQVNNYDIQSYPRFARIVPDDFTFTSVDDFRQFFGLREGSPALGAGEATLAPTQDQNGNPRPTDGNVDLGAFEGSVEGVGPVASDRVFEGNIPSTAFPMIVNGIKDPVYTSLPVPITREIAGQVSDENDLAASWTATWDEETLYLFVAVTDNRLRNDSADPSEDDGVEIFIDADNSRGDSYDGVNDFHYVLGWNDTEVIERSRNATTGVIAAQSSGFTNYTKEIAIPWTTLGIDPTDDLLFGLDFRINDDDNDGAADGRLSWQDRENVATERPANFGSGRLRTVAPPPPVYAAPGAPVIDGQLDAAWLEVPAQAITQVIDTSINGAEDLSATWRALWNPTFLFLYVSVTDDELRDNSSDWFNDDGIELYLDMGLERGRTYDNNDRQLSVSWNSNLVIARQGGLGQGVLASVRNTEVGYDVELRLPWSGLGFTPAEGKFFGFDVQVLDDDGVGGRDGKLAWYASVDESDEDPSLFG
ncbi:MAG: sugar-binding protein, partial [Bacteroidota bacterium]